MMLELLLVILLSAIPAALSYFLDYILGFPAKEDNVNTRAIFFPYTLWLATRRLPRAKYNSIVTSFNEMLNSDDAAIRQTGIQLLHTTLVMEGRKFFTWELAVGMCPLCAGFWIAQLCALVMFAAIPLQYFFEPLFFVLIPIFAHTILRKLLK